MEDGSEGGPSNLSPGQLDGYPKSGKAFTGKLAEALEKGSKYIKRVNGDSISIPKNAEFADHALPTYFPGMKMDSFEHELRAEGYQKRRKQKNEVGSLWLPKKAPQPKGLTPPHVLEGQPSTPGASVPARMVPQASAQLNLGARIDELQSKLSSATSHLSVTKSELDATRSELSATRSELSATRSELNATRSELNTMRSELNATRLELSTTRSELKNMRDLFWDTRSEVKMLTNLLRQLFGRDTEAPVSAGNASSHYGADFGTMPVVAQGSSQMDQVDGFGGIPGGPPPKPNTGTYAAEAPRGVPFGMETGPPYNPVGPNFAAGQPSHPQPPGHGLGPNPGIPHPYPSGHTTPGGPVPQPFLVQQSGFDIMPQEAGPSPRHQQSSTFATCGPQFSQNNGTSSSTTPAHQPSTRTQSSNYYGAYGGPRPPTGVGYVPPKANPNTSNYGAQAQYPQYP